MNNNNDDLFSHAARAARDAGIKQVSDNNDKWATQCLKLFPDLRLSLAAEFTGEDVRKRMEFNGLIPEHPNAWGALMNAACKRGLIKKTGRYTQMRDEQSHARETPLWSFLQSETGTPCGVPEHKTKS